MHKQTPPWMAALAIALIFSAGSPAPAQAQARDEAQRLLQEKQERERAEALSRPAPAVSAPHAADDKYADPAAIPEDATAFDIQHIALQGDTLLTDAERHTVLAPFAGLKMGPRRIDLLLRRVTAAYLQRGYATTRAYLAPQNLAAGTLEITVVPGAVEAVQLNGQPVTGLARSAFPLAAGDPLRIADLEQAVDQINRLRSQKAEAQILPGQSPGASIIALDNRPDKLWRASLGTDTYGQSATGKGRTRLGAEADNLLGAWEAWSLSHVESRNSQADLFSLSAPFGYGTASYAYARSKSAVPIPGIAISRTESRTHTLAWNHILSRDAGGRTALDAALTLRHSLRWLDALELTPQQQASARLALSRQQRLAIGSVSAELGYTQGLDAFSYDVDLPGLPRTAPHNQFEKWDIALAAMFTLSPDWAWRGNLTAQSARTGLNGADQTFIGGASSVRGFQEGILGGDRGYLFKNELQWTGSLPRTVQAEGARLDPFLFHDLGVVRQLASAHDQRLASAGFGLRAAWKFASLDISWGRPLSAPAGIPRSLRAHAALTLQF